MATHFIVTPVSSSAPAFRVVVVDQDAGSRKVIVNVLASDPSIDLITECSDATRARQALAEDKADILFVSVDLPGTSGFDLLPSSPSAAATVLLGTRRSDAAQAFEVHAVDYLVKPFSSKRAEEALKKAKLNLRTIRDPLTGELRKDADTASHFFHTPANPLRHLMLKTNGARILQKVELVECFTSAANYVLVHLNFARLRLRAKLGELERGLDSRKFVRIHRCTIINLDFVRQFRPTNRGAYVVTMNSGTELTVSRRHSENFISTLSSLSYRECESA